MDVYHINNTAQLNGDHEVHKSGCYWLARATNTTSLGYHYGCASAVAQARTIWLQVNGCATCAPACHTG